MGNGSQVTQGNGNRDDLYTLEGMIKMNEGYFTIEAWNMIIKLKRPDEEAKPSLTLW